MVSIAGSAHREWAPERAATSGMRLQMAYRYDERDSYHGVGFLMGVLTGTAIGAGLGILLAPKSGTELRADVRQAAERSAESFRKAKAGRSGEPELDEHA